MLKDYSLIRQDTRDFCPTYSCNYSQHQGQEELEKKQEKKRLQRANVACIIHEKMRSTISCRIEIALVQVYSSFRTSKTVKKTCKTVQDQGT